MPKTTNKNKPVEQIARQFHQQTAPAEAFRVDCAQFTVGESDDGATPFKMFARSKKPVMNWYFGALYHDFDGMKIADRIPVDYCHREDEILGYVDAHQIKRDGLHLSGQLNHQHKGDRVDTVTHQAKNGTPYQASIDFRGDDLIAQEVPEGFRAEVNGETIEGPALIFREWTLRGMAICPHGRDANTRTTFSQDADSIGFRTYQEPDSMPNAKLTDAVKPTNAVTKQQSEKPADDVAPQQTETPAADTPETQQSEPAEDDEPPSTEPEQQQTEKPANTPADQYKSELNKFVQKFGAENGVKWFTDGKTYAEALELHADDLARQLTAKDSEREQLSERLNALKTGEEVPAQQSAESDPQTPAAESGRFAHMGGLGTFAESISKKIRKS